MGHDMFAYINIPYYIHYSELREYNKMVFVIFFWEKGSKTNENINLMANIEFYVMKHYVSECFILLIKLLTDRKAPI